MAKSENAVHLTEKVLDGYQLPDGVAREKVWDDEVPGFGVVVGRTGQTFILNYRADGVMRRQSIGRRGEARGDGRTWNVLLARQRARELLGQVAGGSDPSALSRERKHGQTLREAFAVHLAKMRAARRASGVATMEREMPYVASLLDKPLAAIDRTMLRKEHRRITEECGPFVANRVMRQVRAAWNTARAENPVLDGEPTASVQWNEEYRRQEPIAWAKLPDWYAKISKMTPIIVDRKRVGETFGVRGHYYLVCLLTGIRRTDLATVRWEHLNLDDKPRTVEVWDPGKGKARKPRMIEIELPPHTLLRPCPKGGRKRAFTVPLSAELVKVLRDRQDDNRRVFTDGDGGWVFPSRAIKSKPCRACAALGLPAHVGGAVSHIAEPKEDDAAIVSPHRLRDTYTTACAETPGVDGFAIDVLTNHRPPRGTVTAGYINLSTDYLRTCQEKVTAFLLAKLKPEKERHLHSVA